jgi:hypothetical protein
MSEDGTAGREHMSENVFKASRWDALELLNCEVATALLATLRGSDPVKVICRSSNEAKLMRVRLNALGKRRLDMNEWYWIATKHTKKEPEVVYAWVALHSLETMLSHYRNYPAAALLRMAQEKPRCCLKLRRVDRRIFEGVAAPNA